MLAQSRLVTLTGAGGSGKTRLALRAAAAVMENFPEGAWLVELASVASPALVARAVAAALGVRGSAGRPLLTTLTESLAPRRPLLLVLDNCERLIGACARLADNLLRACPRLIILATSREPLRIPGEAVWHVPALALPAPDPLPPLAELARVESVALFLARASARQPDVTLTARNAPVIAAICRKLDGLPLAIELAAARVGALSVEQIATYLDHALPFLEGGDRTQPRQETLRAALAWSDALLSAEQRALFRTLAVCFGPFDLALARAVSGGGAEDGVTLVALLALVEKSLVERVAGDRPDRPDRPDRLDASGAADGADALDGARYRLLEPVRQYARERLVEAGGEVDAETRHAHHMLALAEEAQPHLMSGQRGPWMARLSASRDNLRAALLWARRPGQPGGAELGLRLTSALSWHWSFLGALSEGLEWLDAALARDQGVDPAIRNQALYFSGELLWPLGQRQEARLRLGQAMAFWRARGERRWLGYALQALAVISEPQEGIALAEESLALFQQVGDRWGEAHAMLSLATIALWRGDPAARAALKACLPPWRALGDDWGEAQALNYLGDLARTDGDDAEAAACYQQSLTLLRAAGLTGTVPSLLHNLGYLALRAGDLALALARFREALLIFRDQGDQRGVAECLSGLAAMRATAGQLERAARLYGAAEALDSTLYTTIWPANAGDYDRGLTTARAGLSPLRFAAAWKAGSALPLIQTFTEALAEDAIAPPAASDTGGARDAAATDAPGLTPREREVARLVARGLTNRQIGAALVITEGTARLHVKHILRKLGFATRAQIAAWVATHGWDSPP